MTVRRLWRQSGHIPGRDYLYKCIMQDYVSYSCFCGMEIEMSRHVFRKGMAYFRKNGFKKAVKRTIYFFTEKRSYEKLLAYTNPTPEGT